jgi:protein SCO1
MKIRILALSVITAALLTACGSKGIKDAYNWQIEDFTYTDQNKEPFGLENLKGKVWVAGFIFTNCVDVCLPMTANMKKIQDEVKKEGIGNVEFVSFSVDPTGDTPEVLTQFGQMFNVDFSNWHFLTGYTEDQIKEFAMNTFRTPVIKPKSGDQIMHGTSLFLIDAEGKIMKDYTGLAEMPLDQILQDIKSLQ